LPSLTRRRGLTGTRAGRYRAGDRGSAEGVEVAFISTDSLFIVARYAVNAPEIVVHERPGCDPATTIERVVGRG
jgi:hypothetical protein